MTVWKEVIKLDKAWEYRCLWKLRRGQHGSLACPAGQKGRRAIAGAVMSGTPWSDLSKTGDTYYANDGIDGTLTYEGFWEAVAKLYANGHDLKDPQLSPVYGDFTGFPPTYIVTGTRDLFLSNTVRVQQKLLQAGVPMQLEVEEGQPHMAYSRSVGIEARRKARSCIPMSLDFLTHI